MGLACGWVCLYCGCREVCEPDRGEGVRYMFLNTTVVIFFHMTW